jgi:hypothetical protein
VFTRFEIKPRFAMLALDNPDASPGYSLYVESADELPKQFAAVLEEQLRRSHHYDLCVRLGQLRPVRVNRVSENAYDVYTGALVNKGMRLGDIKPSPLNRNTDWSDYFGRSDMS